MITHPNDQFDLAIVIRNGRRKALWRGIAASNGHVGRWCHLTISEHADLLKGKGPWYGLDPANLRNTYNVDGPVAPN